MVILKNHIVHIFWPQDPNSPYSQIMQKMASGFEAMFNNSSSADVVAKVTSENPNSKYLAGKDAETLMEAKRSMSEGLQ